MNSTLLIVEDDQSILDTLCMALTIEDYYCLPASSHEEAQAIIELNSIDLALVDYMLSGIPCLPLLTDLETKKIPHVIMTAMNHSAVEAQLPDTTARIYKPFDIDLLIEILSKSLNIKNNS